MVMKHTQTRRCAGFSGNLDRPGEGTVRFETTPFGGRKIATPRPCGPCRIEGKPLYEAQLMVLTRSRIESGPPGTRSFLLPEWVPATYDAGPASGDRRTANPTQVRPPRVKTAKG